MIKAFITKERRSQRGGEFKFQPEILCYCIDDKYSRGGRLFKQLFAHEVMQIIKDIISPEFGSSPSPSYVALVTSDKTCDKMNVSFLIAH